MHHSLHTLVFKKSSNRARHAKSHRSADTRAISPKSYTTLSIRPPAPNVVLPDVSNRMRCPIASSPGAPRRSFESRAAGTQHPCARALNLSCGDARPGEDPRIQNYNIAFVRCESPPSRSFQVLYMHILYPYSHFNSKRLTLSSRCSTMTFIFRLCFTYQPVLVVNFYFLFYFLLIFLPRVICLRHLQSDTTPVRTSHP